MKAPRRVFAGLLATGLALTAITGAFAQKPAPKQT